MSQSDIKIQIVHKMQICGVDLYVKHGQFRGFKYCETVIDVIYIVQGVCVKLGITILSQYRKPNYPKPFGDIANTSCFYRNLSPWFL